MYFGESEYFVYYSLLDGCPYTPETPQFEYIDDIFPWLDGYKPKQTEVDQEVIIPLSEQEEPFTLDSKPTCGWLGLCVDIDCYFYDVQPVETGVLYQGNSDYFVYYSTFELDGCLYEPGELYMYEPSTTFEYIDDNFPWLDGYKPKMSEITLPAQINKAFPDPDECVHENNIVNLDSLPPCGWLGLCADEYCEWATLSPA